MTEQVWWFEPTEHPGMDGSGISPWADYELATLAPKIRNSKVAFTDEDRPTLLYFDGRTTAERRDNPGDFVFTMMGGLLISEAFFDLLSDFDLGETQVIELPLYDGKPVNKFDSVTDLTKRRPGRWFLLHIIARKDSFVYDASRGVLPASEYGSNTPDVPYPEDLSIAVDRSSLEGCDLWREVNFRQKYIFLSDRLRSALAKSHLQLDKLRFRKCALV
ncbi:MAG: hypothetical protein AAFR68_07040 [Pseudomonadota bacterium]